MTARQALVLLIVATAGLRVVWAGSIGLGHDEAYHYLFATHPALSYFDHPPMLAAVESIGLSLGGSSPLALRFGFIGLFAGSTWLMARLTGRFFGDWAGFYAAFALNLSAYHTAAAGAFALPDGPLLFFWLLTIDRIAQAMDEPDRLGRWAFVGLAWGSGVTEQVSRGFPPGRPARLPGVDAVGASDLAQAGALRRDGRRDRLLRAGPGLERGAWLGLVRLPGGSSRLGAEVPARDVAGVVRGAGGVPAALGLGHAPDRDGRGGPPPDPS